ncbi:uncharacterized protein LOC117645915 [Thrips palmi]|uniref:Uncharacterized protein LOC117645915 n=1 Tax=Thrips palmi TaxID=161013 RepID=A0A6P8Z6J7_THRPL|nr:uncharacterized protein LOC117645915 [Thrips palmi]
MKRQANEHPEAPPAEILRQHLPEVPKEALPYLPERHTTKRTFNRRRQGKFPDNPKSLEDLGEIPPEFATTLRGKPFLLYDSYDDDDEEDSDDGQENRRQKRI